MKIVYAEIAKTDLRNIHDFIARNSTCYAKKEIKAIKVAIDKLSSQPQLGLIFKGFNDKHLRELIFKHYRIIYEVSTTNNRIEILTIHHSSRSLYNNPAISEE